MGRTWNNYKHIGGKGGNEGSWFRKYNKKGRQGKKCIKVGKGLEREKEIEMNLQTEKYILTNWTELRI